MTSASGETEANCTARSRPPANITWDVGGDNRTLGPPVTSTDSQGDGTTIVTSTLLFHSSLLKDVSVKCIVHHPGLREPLSVPLDTNGEKILNPHICLRSIFNLSLCPCVTGSLATLTFLLCGSFAVLLLCVCVIVYKCFCKEGESRHTLIVTN